MKTTQARAAGLVVALGWLAAAAGCAAAEAEALLSWAEVEGTPTYVSPRGPHKLLVDADRLSYVLAEHEFQPSAIIEYGNRVLLTVDDAQFRRLDLGTLLDQGVQIRDDLNLIRLRNLTIDTTLAATGGRQDAGYGHYLIQFSRPTDDEQLGEIARLGVERIDYIPNNAMLIWVPRDSMDALQKLSLARGEKIWLSPVAPDWKIDPRLKEPPPSATELVSVVVVLHVAPGIGDSVRDARARSAAVVSEPVERQGRIRMTLRLRPADLERVAELPHVSWVEKWVEPGLFPK